MNSSSLTREEVNSYHKGWMIQHQILKDQNIANNSDINDSKLLQDLTLRICNKVMKNESKNEEKSNKNEKFNQSVGTLSTQLNNYLENELSIYYCPICFDLMLPPLKNPMLLVPCGHSFCKECLKNKKTKPICALCRANIEHQVPNIALSSLISQFGQKKTELVNQTIVENNHQDEIEEDTNIDYVKSILQIDIRIQVLEEEREKFIQEISSVQNSLQAIEKFLSQLNNEKNTRITQKTQIEKEISLIDQEIDIQKNKLTSSSSSLHSLSSQLELIKDTLYNLQTEKDKYLILSSIN